MRRSNKGPPPNYRFERGVRRGWLCAASALRYLALPGGGRVCGRPLNVIVAGLPDSGRPRQASQGYFYPFASAIAEWRFREPCQAARGQIRPLERSSQIST
jgi:hypothetical protein